MTNAWVRELTLREAVHFSRVKCRWRTRSIRCGGEKGSVAYQRKADHHKIRLIGGTLAGDHIIIKLYMLPWAKSTRRKAKVPNVKQAGVKEKYLKGGLTQLITDAFALAKWARVSQALLHTKGVRTIILQARQP